MKCFKNKIGLMLFVLALGLVLGLNGQAFAITLGYPDISFDSSHGAGNNTFVASAGAHYNASTGFLGVSSVALTMTFDGVTHIDLVNGTLDYRVKLDSVTVDGNYVTGSFETDGVAGNDLILQDDSGVLLTGVFKYYDLEGKIGKTTGSGEAVFEVTGGSLASYFEPFNEGGMVHLEFNLSKTFSANMFASNFDGQVKGDIAPVPEPSTVALLGLGLAGLGLYNWRRKNS